MGVATALAPMPKSSSSTKTPDQPIKPMRPSQLPELMAELPHCTTSIDCRLPNELMLFILDCFIPRSDMCISNGEHLDQHHPWIISALLKTCHKLKLEILARAFNHPLLIKSPTAGDVVICKWRGPEISLRRLGARSYDSQLLVITP
jgi:hypothetical protein